MATAEHRLKLMQPSDAESTFKDSITVGSVGKGAVLR